MQWIRVSIGKWELIFVTPFRIKYGSEKWERRDCATAHRDVLRTYCARTVSSSPRRRSPSVPVRMIWPGIRVKVGGTSTVSGYRRIIPNRILFIVFVMCTPCLKLCYLVWLGTNLDQSETRELLCVAIVACRRL